MQKYIILIILTIFSIKAEATLVGSAASPGIYTDGLFSKNQTFYMRAGYYYDNIYRAKYKDTDSNDAESNYSTLKLQSQGAIITLNIKNRWDLYTLLGVAKTNIDNQIYTNDRFSWCVGTKVILLKIGNFDFTIDGKYFQTRQNIEQFIIDKEVFPIITPHYGNTIEEYQGAFCMSYKTKNIIPYVGATYLYSTISPYPSRKGLIRYPVPYEDVIDDFISNDAENNKKWGLVVGVSLISSNKISINIESRMIDQNAINISTDIRF